MTLFGFSSTDQLINLIRNGAFEFKDGDALPFWSIVGNSQLVDSSDGPTKALEITLSTQVPATITQSFRTNESHMMDFAVPIAANIRPSIGGGYSAFTTMLLPHKTPLTLSMAVKVLQGRVKLSVTGDDLYSSGNLVLTPYGDATKILSNEKKWVRPAFRFSSNKGIAELQIKIERAPGADLTVVQLSHLALYHGYYDHTTFTGDPLARCIPAGAIILCMGAYCPPGFAELGEDDLTPPLEWQADEPTIAARKGNYPRSAPGLTGAPTHNTSNPGFAPLTSDIVSFEGFDSKIALTRDGTGGTLEMNVSVLNPATDLPDAAGKPTHSHVLKNAGSRPSGVALRFCKRL